MDRASPVPPSPPKEWRASIEEDVSDGESPTKDVEIELGERHEEEDDDHCHSEQVCSPPREAAALAVDPAPTTKIADGVSISMVALGTGSGQKGDVASARAEASHVFSARRERSFLYAHRA